MVKVRQRKALGRIATGKGEANADLSVLSDGLNIHRARHPWMDVNVVTPADPI